MERDELGTLEPLPSGWFGRPSPVVAPALLGMLLVSRTPEGTTIGRIVETEAYDGPDDGASHARAGRTRRTAVMFGPPGRAYVYLVYGMHHCLNVVTDADGVAGAVLVRAVEPVGGIDLMRQRCAGAKAETRRLAAGPALVCRAFGIDRSHDGADLTAAERLWISAEAGAAATSSIAVVTGPRLGVAYAGAAAHWPWRFGIEGHPSLSRRI